MTKLFHSLLGATCVLSLAATGCIKKDEPSTDAIDKAIPTSDQVQINIPGQARVVGQLAQYYVTTRDVTTMFNGGAAWVLVLIHSITQYPVTSVNGDVYTWGPWSGSALDPASYKLDVTANVDGSYDYTFSGQSKTAPGAQFEALIDGHAVPGAVEGQGNGDFLLDFDAIKNVDPIDNPTAQGSIDAHYDLAARHLDLHIMANDTNGNPDNADYSYDQGADGSGDMTFSVNADIGGTPLLENVTMRSRWLPTGDGRGDARIEGGDLGTEQAIGSECWNTLFQRVYYTDNVNFEPTEGEPTQCAYATVDLP